MKNLSRMVLAALFTGLMVAGALISIPFPGVPMVIADAFPWLAGLLLGPVGAAASAGLYLLLGVFGLPVFAKGAAGLGVLVGPTGGFLWGYLLAAILVGLLRDANQQRLWRMSLAVAAGIVVTYLPGILWLSFVLYHGAALAPASLIKAFTLATGPAGLPLLFLFGDLVKGAGVVAIASILVRLPGGPFASPPHA